MNKNDHDSCGDAGGDNDDDDEERDDDDGDERYKDTVEDGCGGGDDNCGGGNGGKGSVCADAAGSFGDHYCGDKGCEGRVIRDCS